MYTVFSGVPPGGLQLDIKLIQVESTAPFRGQPLYRTGRAAFPHPAPCEAYASVVVVDTDIYPGVSQLALLQQVIEPIPVIALALASPVQPEEQR